MEIQKRPSDQGKQETQKKTKKTTTINNMNTMNTIINTYDDNEYHYTYY